ncbi:FAD-dependent oxidoreductase, partial [Faecalibacterium prausnitzii]|nr:FAD-dependent oxidoreductase [Faecalibacterium prausnitzii]
MEKVQSYDVVVVGGGAAGIAAAVGAAQAGAACLLVERNGSLGGQATNANVASYCGFFTHSNPPQQIVRGVGQQVLELLHELGAYDGYRLSSVQNAIVTLDEEALKYALDLLVQRYSGLKVLLHCRMISAQTSPDGSIQSIHCV